MKWCGIPMAEIPEWNVVNILMCWKRKCFWGEFHLGQFMCGEDINVIKCHFHKALLYNTRFVTSPNQEMVPLLCTLGKQLCKWAPAEGVITLISILKALLNLAGTKGKTPYCYLTLFIWLIEVQAWGREENPSSHPSMPPTWTRHCAEWLSWYLH